MRSKCGKRYFIIIKYKINVIRELKDCIQILIWIEMQWHPCGLLSHSLIWLPLLLAFILSTAWQVLTASCVSLRSLVSQFAHVHMDWFFMPIEFLKIKWHQDLGAYGFVSLKAFYVSSFLLVFHCCSNKLLQNLVTVNNKNCVT